jgi:NitT/TauT family transport system substrate-binding protein
MKNIVARCLAFAVLMGVLAGPSAVTAIAKDPDVVQLGWQPNLAYAPVFIAIERGYLADENIRLAPSATRIGTDALMAVAAGQLDASVAPIAASMFNGAIKGLGGKLVASMAVRSGALLLVRKDLWDSGAVRDGKGLVGRRFAVSSPGGSMEYKVSMVMSHYGYKLSDVQSAPLNFPDMLVAFQFKGIDAAFISDPYASEAVQRGLAVVDQPDSEIGSAEITTGLVFGETFIRDRPDVGKRFVKALIRGARDLQGEGWRKPETLAILSKYTKAAPEVIASGIFPLFDPDLSIDKYLDSLTRQATVHIANKRTQPAALPLVKTLVDPQFVAGAVAELGPFKP